MRRNSQRSKVEGLKVEGQKVRGLYGQPFVNEDGELCRYATRWESFKVSAVFWIAFLLLIVLIWASRCMYHWMFDGFFN